MGGSSPGAGTPEPSLWHNRSFRRLWLAQAVSNAGSQVTNLALPLTAALALGATPGQMGILGIAGSLPNLLFGLFAGVWVDRAPRRPVLVGAELGRAVLLGSIPLAALLGFLSFAQLYAVAFAAGIRTMLFTLASVAVLPSVVRSERLVEANSSMELSASVLSIAGPGVAGGLIQLVTAPVAIAVDAASYVLSALWLRGVREAGEPPSRGERRSVWAEIGEGVRELVRTPLLRALTISASASVLGVSVQGTVLVLFLTRDLGLTPATIGLVYATGGAGSLAGAILAGPAGRLLGAGPAVVLGQGLWTLGTLLVPVAGLGGLGLAPLVAGQVSWSIGGVVWSVNQMSLRQHLTPVRLLGRVTAARRFLLFGAAPVGSALGGALGGALGLRATLAIGAAALVLGFALTVFSPIRAVRALSDVGGGG